MCSHFLNTTPSPSLTMGYSPHCEVVPGQNMDIGETLGFVLENYPKATDEPFAEHAVARYLRNEAVRAIEAGLGELNAGLSVVGSAGAGNWASVPWISVFDPVVTDSATRGYYVVYLFHSAQPQVHLSLNQGTTAVRSEFGNTARDVLRDRAVFMRRRLEEFVERLPITRISLGSSRQLPLDYEAGHVLGLTYGQDAFSDEAALRADLQEISRAYRLLTFRGGLQPSF